MSNSFKQSVKSHVHRFDNILSGALNDLRFRGKNATDGAQGGTSESSSKSARNVLDPWRSDLV